MPRPEYRDVERPFIEQLQAQGWEYVQGALDDPRATGREPFAQVIQEQVLREQLYRINRRDGRPWLDEDRLSQAVGALTRIPACSPRNDIFLDRVSAGPAIEALIAAACAWVPGRGGPRPSNKTVPPKGRR